MNPFWKNKRVLLTGHTGFKGCWMALWLHQMGATVFGYALEPDTDPALFNQLELDGKIHHHIGNISDADALAAYVAETKADFVFHLAAQSLVLRSYRDTLETWNTNVMGTANLLEALRKSAHACTVVVVTTDKVYQNLETKHAYRETDRLGGIDPYSASKAGTELVVGSYRSLFAQETLPIKLASARAGNVIGGGDWCENRLLPDIARALMQGNSIETRNPNAVRPWQHVLEPLAGYMLLAEKITVDNSLATAFNFGPDATDNRTVEDVIQTALKTWDGTYHANADPAAPHEAGLLMLAIDKARTTLGWHPKWDFSTAVINTMTWYKETAEGRAPLEITLEQIKKYEAA
ncbi:MAG: CDP-glucose 4,6-dehydratase [Amylibacter sp.]|nr:CDP-glucose 4,6-dehydratase [Amylibacter sp.]